MLYTLARQLCELFISNFHTMKKYLLVGILLAMSLVMYAQGPPITSDKPIMLGSGTVVIKTLTEIRNTDAGTYTRVPAMVHYLPTSNSLLAVHLPIVFRNVLADVAHTSGLGDIDLMAKYQFYRKDATGKTFRMVAKTIQTLPTGREWNVADISTGDYASYLSLVAGYESIKYGISNELGYRLVPGRQDDELRYKLGFGLPLLKPTYPVKQVNLYFEYNANWMVQSNDFLLFYAQGIQYAKGRLTLETSIQTPLIQSIVKTKKRNYALFFCTRYVF